MIGNGEPLINIVISPGNHKFEVMNPSTPYVALSRVKSSGINGTDPDFE